jgi:tryptophan 2,3-dioxygenase
MKIDLDRNTTYLNADIQRVKDAESNESLLVLLNHWLERMPFTKNAEYWGVPNETIITDHPFWQQYRTAYAGGLSPAEAQNLNTFDLLFLNDKAYPSDRRLSAKASRSAFFIMLYRDYPLLQLPYELLSTLLEIDELMSLWRHRHIHMVQRTIGKRVGTGGSTGAGYLKSAADSHVIFKEIAELSSFLLPRHDLPVLPEHLAHALGYK